MDRVVVAGSVSNGASAANIAAMDETQQAAYISALYPGRSLDADDIRRAVQREQYNAEHKGHEGKHLAMFLIFIFVLAMLPATVKHWRQRYPTSYRLVSVGSICLIPPYFALGNEYYRFVTLWIGYAVANTYVLYLATRKPLYPRTPRRVYQWFSLINKMSYGVSVVGFVLFLLCFFNVAPGLTNTESFVETSMVIMFYGLYFGLMSRDLVVLCSDRITATLGYSSSNKTGLPTKHLAHNVCGICSDQLAQGGSNTDSGLLHAGAEAVRPTALAEPTHELDCGHVFHATCIRGWCVIGKKETCPFCSEKVDLTPFKQNPWDRQELVYISALEYMRFFISWQPLTLLLMAGIFWILGLD
ncbi:hypothetical protein LPJ63_001413 [Coemansia sp. RSA 2711]|nr:hypothetical protein LPJ63_001413 [Coemansia sp. RSA 2711]